MGILADRYKQTFAPAQPLKGSLASGVSPQGTDLPTDQPSVLGFLGNTVEGLGDFGMGLLALVQTGINDNLALAEEVLTLGTRETDFMSDDLYEGITGTGKFSETGSLLVNDYQKRYGGGWDNIRHQLYESPVSFIADALTVASLGAGGAAKLARAGGFAAKSNAAARSLAGAASHLDDAGRLAGGVQSSLDDLARATTAAQTGVVASAPPSRLAKVAQALVGTEKYIVGRRMPRVSAYVPPKNPYRGIYSNTMFRFGTRTPDSALKEAAAMEQAAVEVGSKAMRLEAEALRNSAELAKTLGPTARVAKAGFDVMKMRRMTDLFLGTAGARHIEERNRLTALFKNLFHDKPDELTPEQLHFALQDIDPALHIDARTMDTGTIQKLYDLTERLRERNLTLGDTYDAIRSINHIDQVPDIDASRLLGNLRGLEPDDYNLLAEQLRRYSPEEILPSYEELMLRADRFARGRPFLETLMAPEVEGGIRGAGEMRFSVRNHLGRDLGELAVYYTAGAKGTYLRVGNLPSAVNELAPDSISQLYMDLRDLNPSVAEIRQTIGKVDETINIPLTSLPPSPEVVHKFNLPHVGVGEASPQDYFARRVEMSDQYKNELDMEVPSDLEIEGSRPYLTDDGQGGYYLTPEGELKGLFTTDAALPGTGKALVLHALEDAERSGQRLHVSFFDGYLTRWFGQFGFKPEGFEAWDAAYAPMDWDVSTMGRPAVVHMSYEGGPVDTLSTRFGRFAPIDTRFRAATAGDLPEGMGPATSAELRGAVGPDQPGAAGPGVGARPPAGAVAKKYSFRELMTRAIDYAIDTDTPVYGPGYTQALWDDLGYSTFGDAAERVFLTDAAMADAGLITSGAQLRRFQGAVERLWELHPDSGEWARVLDDLDTRVAAQMGIPKPDGDYVWAPPIRQWLKVDAQRMGDTGLNLYISDDAGKAYGYAHANYDRNTGIIHVGSMGAGPTHEGSFSGTPASWFVEVVEPDGTISHTSRYDWRMSLDDAYDAQDHATVMQELQAELDELGAQSGVTPDELDQMTSWQATPMWDNTANPVSTTGAELRDEAFFNAFDVAPEDMSINLPDGRTLRVTRVKPLGSYRGLFQRIFAREFPGVWAVESDRVSGGITQRVTPGMGRQQLLPFGSSTMEALASANPAFIEGQLKRQGYLQYVDVVKEELAARGSRWERAQQEASQGALFQRTGVDVQGLTPTRVDYENFAHDPTGLPYALVAVADEDVPRLLGGAWDPIDEGGLPMRTARSIENDVSEPRVRVMAAMEGGGAQNIDDLLNIGLDDVRMRRIKQYLDSVGEGNPGVMRAVNEFLDEPTGDKLRAVARGLNGPERNFLGDVIMANDDWRLVRLSGEARGSQTFLSGAGGNQLILDEPPALLEAMRGPMKMSWYGVRTPTASTSRLIDPTAIEWLDGQLPRGPADDELFRTRLAAAGYTTPDAPIQAAVDFDRLAAGELDEVALARLQSLEKADLWATVRNHSRAKTLKADELDEMFRDVRALKPTPPPSLPPAIRRTEALGYRLEGVPPTGEYGPTPRWVGDRNTFHETAEMLRISLHQRLAETFGWDSIARSRVKPASSINRDLAAVTADGLEFNDIGDLVGARVVVPDATGFGPAIEQLREVGAVTRVVNTMLTPSGGDRRLLVTLNFEGQPVEVQLVTPTGNMVEQANNPLRAWITDAQTRKLADPDNWTAERDLDIEKAHRMMEMNAEATVDELRTTLGGERQTWMRRKQMQTRLAVATEFEGPMYDFYGGTFTPAMAFDRAYRPMQAQQGAHFDFDTNGWIGGPSTLELDDEVRKLGLPAPVYFPYFDARRVKTSDFIMARKTVGLRSMTKPGYERKFTGNLIGRDFVLKDPAEAYSRRAAQAVRREEALNLVEHIIGTYGRRVTSFDELQNGEVLFAPDGFLRFYRMKVHLDDNVLRQVLEEGEDMDQTIYNVANEIIVRSQDDLARRYGRSIGVTSKDLELYAVPKVVAERLEKYSRPHFGVGMRLFWDTPNEVWRSIVLQGSPRWIVNNILGNFMYLKMQGGRLTDVLRQLNPRYRKMIQMMMGEQPRAAVEGGFVDSMRVTNLGSARETKMGQFYEAVGQTRVSLGGKKVGTVMKTFNSFVEDAFRRASYLTAAERVAINAGLKKGMRSFITSRNTLDTVARVGLDERLWKKAVDEVNYFLNDYSMMTPFGRNVIRRFLIPFWAFYRHAAQLLLTFPFTHPARFTAIRALGQVALEMQAAQTPPIPQWAMGSIPLGPGDQPGEMRFLAATGPNPFSQVTEGLMGFSQGRVGALAQSANPVMKMAYEQLTGRSTLTGRPFSDPAVVEAFGTGQQYRVERTRSGELTYEPVEVVAPNIIEHALQQLPQYELMKDLVGGARAYDTSSLFDIWRGHGVIRDPMTGEPRYPLDKKQVLGKWMGLSTFDINTAEYAAMERENSIAALRAWLRRYGYIPPSTTTSTTSYTPPATVSTTTHYGGLT